MARPADRDTRPSPEMLHYDVKILDLDYRIMQTMLMDLLNSGIKPFICSKLTALNYKMTRKMKTICISKMINMTNIQADHTNKIINQFKEENTQLRTQMADLTRELCSTAAAKATYT